MTKKEVLKKIRKYSIIVLCALLLALNYHIFIINNKFAPSGINGIGTMLQYKFNFSIGYFSLLINIPLCIACFIMGNKKFSIRTMVFSLSYSLFYLLLGKIDLEPFKYYSNDVDVIIPVFTAAIISGFVYGSVFKQNASTGGTDVIAKMVTTKHPQFNFFWIVFGFNVVVAIISYFVYGTYNEEIGKIVYNLKPVLLCIIYAYVTSMVGNSLLKGTKTAIKFEVITDHPEEIAKELIETIHHGVTLINVTGMYSHTQKGQLVCVVNKHQLYDFKQIIEKYPNTFAYVIAVDDTIGNFKKIKK